MASQLTWTMYAAIAVAIGSFVASPAEAQQSPWPAYGAPAGRIVIRPRVQHIKWRPAHTPIHYGGMIIPVAVYPVGSGNSYPTPAPAPTSPAPAPASGTGVEGTFSDLARGADSHDRTPRTCERAKPATCEAEEPAEAPRAVTPPAPELKPEDGAEQKASPTQKTSPTQKGGPAQKTGNLDVKLHQLLADSESLLQELREGVGSEVYVARSARDQR